MWTDNETTEDLIGFRVHADLIRAVATDPQLLPVTVGLFADWGGGKTSVMRMLQRELEPESTDDPEKSAKLEKTACLYFNGWLFEGYDDAKAALLSSILLALGEHKRFGPKVRDNAAELLKSVNWMRAARLGLKAVALPALAAYVTGGASVLPSASAAIAGMAGGLIPRDRDDRDSSDDTSGTGESSVDWESLIKRAPAPAGPMDVRTFRERFAALLKDSDIENLVVLIDDLDRCSPDRIIDNLEAVKLFLNVDRTAFVIGADPRIVRHAIAARYRTHELEAVSDGNASEDADRLITDYLEKLIQVPYWLPRLSPAETETYMALLFSVRALHRPELDKCLAACAKQRAENRYGTFGYAAIEAALGAEDFTPELAESLTLCANVAPLITEGLKGNPRQVKRFLNALVLRKRLADVAKLANIRDDVLVKLMILEYADPSAFRELFGWQASQDGHPAQLRAMEQALEDKDEQQHNDDPPWSSAFRRRWIAMNPRLGDIDLRDYFWVARDKMASTFAGLSLVAPLVRRTLEDLLSNNPALRDAAAKAAAALEDRDREALLDLLASHLTRRPDDKPGYDAFRMLVEHGVGGSSAALGATLGGLALDRIPAASALDLRGLAQAHPASQSALNPQLDRIANSNTPAGRALSPKKGSR